MSEEIVSEELVVEAPQTPRLKQEYKDVIIPELEKEFKHDNPMQIPRIEKVVVSMGVGAAARDSKLIEGAVRDLTAITGQKPKITKAKKSVAQFHLREGQAIGAYVTPNALSRRGFRRPVEPGSTRAADLQRRYLPTGLRNAWQLAAVRLLTKADAAQTELAVHGMRTAADHATGVCAHLELRLAQRLDLKTRFCHFSSP